MFNLFKHSKEKKFNYEKYFVIGFNKTGTSTFHYIFLNNGLTSQHNGSEWNIEEYQCFSDNGNFRDWKLIDKMYKNCIFILNTRPLDEWIRSRAKHCYTEQLAWGYPPSIELYKNWTKERNNHHLALLNHFKENTKKLILVDIKREYWLNFVCEELNLKYYDVYINESPKSIPEDHIDNINRTMYLAFDDLEIPESEHKNKLVIESLLSKEEIESLRKLKNIYTSNIDGI